jgi:hypothetical protein
VPREFAKKVYLVMASMAQIPKNPDPGTISAMIRDMHKSVLRGVTDFTRFSEFDSEGTPCQNETHVAANPAVPGGGLPFNAVDPLNLYWKLKGDDRRAGFSGALVTGPGVPKKDAVRIVQLGDDKLGVLALNAPLTNADGTPLAKGGIAGLSPGGRGEQAAEMWLDQRAYGKERFTTHGGARSKFAASSVLPEPLYLVRSGNGKIGRVRTIFPDSSRFSARVRGR